MRIVFVGTSELGMPALRTLAGASKHEIPLVISQPDRPTGRKLALTPPPIKKLALELGLPVIQPEKIRQPAAVQTLQDLRTDLIIVAAYGQIIPKSILQLPGFGVLNIHTSLLPKYRGASPIQSAILNGDETTGVTIMQMDEGLDTGPILSQSETPIGPNETASELHDRLALLGCDLLMQTISQIEKSGILPRPQPTEGVSYAKKIKKQDGEINWQESAEIILRKMRAFHPWPGVFTYLKEDGCRVLLKVLQAGFQEVSGEHPGRILSLEKAGIVVGTGKDGLMISHLQKEGGKKLPAHEFLAGHPLKPGTLLGNES